MFAPLPPPGPLLRQPGDPQLSADCLRGLQARREAYSLELLPDVVVLIESTLSLPQEAHMELGVEVALTLYRAYGQVWGLWGRVRGIRGGGGADAV